MSKKTKIIVLSITVVFFLISVGMVLYPMVSAWYIDNHQAGLEMDYLEKLEEKDDTELVEARKLAEEYNQLLVPGTHQESAFTEEAMLKAAENYGDLLNVNGDSIMAYVEIPKINVNLPVYHGTDPNVLERGLGHLVGSSLPVGGKGTHSIITGHSGLASQRLFSDLEDLEIDDVFYVKVLGETLAYKVDQITVVLPFEIADLYIDDNEDYVTLITCTPYAVNTHRLLVRGTRIPYVEAEEIVEQQTQEDSGKNISTWERGWLKGIMMGLIAAVCLLLIVLLYLIVHKSHTSARKKGSGEVETPIDTDS